MPDQPAPEILIPSEIYPPDAEAVVYYTRPQQKYWLNLLLLLATFCTTLVVGARLQWNFEHGLPPFPRDESFKQKPRVPIPSLVVRQRGFFLYCSWVDTGQSLVLRWLQMIDLAR